MTSSLRLFAPLTVGAGTEHALTLANRVLMGPMTRGRATEDGVPTEIMIKYYEQRASAGLIFSEATGVSRQGLGWHYAPGIYTAEQRDAWKPVVDAVHAKGGKIYLQLWHMGRQMHSEVSGMPIVSASAIPIKGGVKGKNHADKEGEVPHALTEEEIAGVVKDYGNAARLSMEAGFDGVEVHAANGYLIDQFNQSCSNTRTDKYGGSVENRLRMLTEVLEEVLTAVPRERVSVRLSPNGAFGEMGSADNVETFTAAVALLAQKRVGMIHLMDGLGFGFHEKTEPFTSAQARAIIREHGAADSTALVCNVGYTKESAEAQLEAAAKEDAPVEMAVCMGRPFIANPDLVARLQQDLPLAEAPYSTWWGTNTTEGYSDWPVAGAEEVAKA